MYRPQYVQQEDRSAAAQLIHQNGFGVLVSQAADQSPQAAHLLMELTEEGEEWTLWGHMAKANPLWQSWQGQSVLAIFSGAHHYISPSWYNHPNVPTWNYSVVHCYGVPEVLEDPVEVKEMLLRSVKKYEKPDSGYSLDQLPEKVLMAQLAAIVPFKIPVQSMEAAFKLSQNRDEANFLQILQNLEQLQTEASRGMVNDMQTFGRKTQKKS